MRYGDGVKITYPVPVKYWGVVSGHVPQPSDKDSAHSKNNVTIVAFSLCLNRIISARCRYYRYIMFLRCCTLLYIRIYINPQQANNILRASTCVCVAYTGLRIRVHMFIIDICVRIMSIHFCRTTGIENVTSVIYFSSRSFLSQKRLYSENSIEIDPHFLVIFFSPVHIVGTPRVLTTRRAWICHVVHLSESRAFPSRKNNFIRMFLYNSIIITLCFVIKAIIIAIIIIISPYHDGCLLLLINTRKSTTCLNDSHLNECVYDDDTMSCEVIVYY